MLKYYPKKYREKVLNEVISNIKLKEPTCITYLRDTGKRAFFVYLSEKIKLKFKENKIVILDLENFILSKEDLIEEISSVLNTKVSPKYLQDLMNNLQEFFTQNETQIILNINLNSLTDSSIDLIKIILGLRHTFPGNIIPIFNLFWKHNLESIINKIDRDFLLKRHTIYFGPFLDDFSEAISYFANKGQYNLTKGELSQLKKLSGGIPMIYKHLYLCKTKKGLDLSDNSFIKQALESEILFDYFQDLLNDLGEELANSLYAISKGKKSSEESLKRLTKLELISIKTKKPEINSKYFEQFFVHIPNQFKEQSSSPIVFKGDRNISIEGKDYPGLFTEAEEKILRAILTDENGIATKYEIAETLWASEANEKYSEYAIDRHLSNIRKKLEGKTDIRLKTIKGKGIAIT